MSTDPEGGGLGDPHEVDREGLLHRESAPPEETHEEPAVEHNTNPKEYAFDEIPPPIIIDMTIETLRHKVPRSFLESSIKPKNLNYPEGYFPVLPLGMYLKEEKPAVDGSEFAQEAFGGFGPDSPEYDNDEPRLEILIPDSKSAVSWFKDAVIEDGLSWTTNRFGANIPEARHPSISRVEIEFRKTPETVMVNGKISPHHYALSTPEAPETTEDGTHIDTYNPAAKMLSNHLSERLVSLYPDKVQFSEHSKDMVIDVEDDMSLHLDYSNLPYLNVTVNGDTAAGSGGVRFGQAKPTPRQLEKELKIMQEHFPAIVETYADFFRKQLPKTTIEVDYNSQSAESPGQHDPIEPQRLSKLRQELVMTPREDDFKYIGGLDSDIARLKESAIAFGNPEAFEEFGVTPPRGILLKGPPGTGKTSLAMAFARDADAVVLNVKASTIKSAFHGETERNIRGVFGLADELVDEDEKVVIFMDEIESLAPARDSMGSTGIDKNVTTELLQGLNVDRKDCVVIAATNAPGLVDPALINNSSRFSQQLEIGLPDTEARKDILRKLFQKFTDKSTSGSHSALFESDIEVKTIAEGSQDLSGADLENAIRKVLFTKAVVLATTGNKPGPATNSEIYQSIKNVTAAKQIAGENYL